MLNRVLYLGLTNPSLRERFKMNDYILDILNRCVRLIRELLPTLLKSVENIGKCRGKAIFLKLK